MMIFRVTALTDEVAEAFARLIPQLKVSLPPLSREGLARLLASDTSVLLAARYLDERAPIQGLLTLVVYRVPTGVHARIEDVVVDEAVRGQGIGEALVRRALHVAQEAGADGAMLFDDFEARHHSHIGPLAFRSHLAGLDHPVSYPARPLLAPAFQAESTLTETPAPTDTAAPTETPVFTPPGRPQRLQPPPSCPRR